MNEKIQTPEQYVDILLNEAEYIQDIYGKKVLENSCGDGNILCRIVDRFILDAKRKGVENDELKKKLQENICGYEIDQEQISRCRNRLDQLAGNYGLCNINWNIRQEDYLKSECGQYDYIFSNPPYITYHDLTQKQRVDLRTLFISCKKGRFDYYYAFIEKSIESLTNSGIMVFLIPFSLFRNHYAECVRSMLLPGLEKVIDLQGKMVFPSVLISTAIIKYSRGKEQQSIFYQCESRMSQLTVNKERLTGKWFFTDNKDQKRTFGDYFIVQNSVATLCNNVFIFEPKSEDDTYYYIDDKYRIEKSIAYSAISAKSSKSNAKRRMIIVPYYLYKGGYKRYSTEDFANQFPDTTEYLMSRLSELSNRAVEKNNNWFEYGRSQALSSVFGEKLVIPMIATNQYHVVLAREKDIPFAGYFVKAKDGGKESLLQAKDLLESLHFYQYICEHGTPTTKNSYRISVKEILNYPIDNSISVDSGSKNI